MRSHWRRGRLRVILAAGWVKRSVWLANLSTETEKGSFIFSQNRLNFVLLALKKSPCSLLGVKRDPQAFQRSIELRDNDWISDWCQYRRRGARAFGREGTPRLPDALIDSLRRLTGEDPETEKKESRASTADLTIPSFSDEQFQAKMDQIYTSDMEENGPQ